MVDRLFSLFLQGYALSVNLQLFPHASIKNRILVDDMTKINRLNSVKNLVDSVMKLQSWGVRQVLLKKTLKIKKPVKKGANCVTQKGKWINHPVWSKNTFEMKCFWKWVTIQTCTLFLDFLQNFYFFSLFSSRNSLLLPKHFIVDFVAKRI